MSSTRKTTMLGRCFSGTACRRDQSPEAARAARPPPASLKNVLLVVMTRPASIDAFVGRRRERFQILDGRLEEMVRGRADVAAVVARRSRKACGRLAGCRPVVPVVRMLYWSTPPIMASRPRDLALELPGLLVAADRDRGQRLRGVGPVADDQVLDARRCRRRCDRRP